MKNYSRRYCTSLLLTVLCSSCGQVESGNPAAAPEIQKSIRSLRLVQNTDPNSPVAVSIGTDSRETIIVLARSASSEGAEQILYTSTDGQVAVISVNDVGLPLRSETRNANFSFGNYTSTTVDVEPVIDGVTYPVRTVPLQEETLAILTKGSLSTGMTKAISASNIIAIIRRATVAVRTFGCAGFLATPTQGNTGNISSFTQNTCRSRITDALREISETESDDAIIERVETSSTLGSQCSVGDFSAAEQCANNVRERIVAVIEIEEPSIDSLADDAEDGVLGNEDGQAGFGTDDETDGGGTDDGSTDGGGTDGGTDDGGTDDGGTDDGGTDDGGTDDGGTDNGGELPEPPTDFTPPPPPPSPEGPFPI